MRDVHIRFH